MLDRWHCSSVSVFLSLFVFSFVRDDDNTIPILCLLLRAFIVPRDQSCPALRFASYASIIVRSSAGVVRLMRAVASDHGTEIRGTSRAANQDRRVKKSYIIAGVSHWNRPRTKHHRSRHVSTGATDDILTTQHLNIFIQ